MRILVDNTSWNTSFPYSVRLDGLFCEPSSDKRHKWYLERVHDGYCHADTWREAFAWLHERMAQ